MIHYLSFKTATATLLLSLGCFGPASALDFSGAPAEIQGIAPGMSFDEARNHLLKIGMVALNGSGTRTGSSGDLVDTRNELVGSVFSFGDTETMDMVYLEVGAEGALENTVFRVTGVAPADSLSEEDQDEIMARFGPPACGNNRFHFDADWAPLANVDCQHVLVRPSAPMDEAVVRFAATDAAPQYSAILGALPGAQPQLLTSIQDNRLAAATQANTSSEPQEAPEAEPVTTSSAKDQIVSEVVEPDVPNIVSLPNDKTTDTSAEFQIQSLHEVELGEERDSAIAKLEAAGFTRGDPMPTWGRMESHETAADGGKYKLSRYHGAHDNFEYAEWHAFERGNLTVQLQTIPPGPNGKVVVVQRTEEIAEPIHLKAAVKSVVDRASLQPSCAERSGPQMEIGYQIDANWRLVDIPRGGMMCLSELWITSSDYSDDLRNGEIGNRKFHVRFSGSRVPLVRVSSVTMTLTDVEGSLIQLSDLKAKSDAARNAEASQQGLSDF